MEIEIKKKKEFLDLASDFSRFAEKHNWISRYDVESDALSVTVPRLSDDARIKYFNDEIAFYITKNRKIEGIFIEYFKGNFLKHHKNSVSILRGADTRDDQEKSLIELSVGKMKKIAPALEEAIKMSLAERLNLNPQT